MNEQSNKQANTLRKVLMNAEYYNLINENAWLNAV